MKEALMKCDEFKEATEFVILATPFADNGKEAVKTVSVKIGEKTKFKNKVYLYSLMETPEIFDPRKIHVPVKNGACITPVQYDPITFMPRKEILLSVNVEQELERKILHDLLDDILDNPKEYAVRGEKGIIVRGIFETIANGDNESNYEIGELNLDYDNPKFYSVMCLENKNIDGAIFLNVETKFIPTELKDEFLKIYADKLKNISVEDVDSFLNKHKKILL